jgi:hypothetical protein
MIMQNETEEKKTWQTPNIYDLDVNETSGKTYHTPSESIPGSGPS